MLGRQLGDPLLIEDYIERAVSKLTPIAKAIYNSSMVKNARIGFGRIFKIPAFLQKKESEQSRLIVYESYLANVAKYLFPVVMYRRAVNTFLEKSPDALDPIFIAADCIIYTALFGRIFLRRLFDNTINTRNLVKAVTKDVQYFLTHKLTANLAVKVGPHLAKIFFERDLTRIFVNVLGEELQPVFENFFSNNINAESMPQLKESVEKTFNSIFNYVLKHFDDIKIKKETAKLLAKCLAKAIVEELTSAIFTMQHKSQIMKFKENLYDILAKQLSNKAAKEYRDKILSGIADACLETDLQNYMPDKTLQSCGCKYEKTLKGSISASLYYTGITLLTYIPNVAEWAGIFRSVNPFIYKLSFLLRALLYGQSFSEERFNSVSLCTRHRYYIGMANKIRYLFEGLAYIADIELNVLAVKWLTGIDDFFVRDAIASFLLPIHLLPTYAFNEPLHPPKKNPFDLFEPFRVMTRSSFTRLRAWFFPHLKDEEARRRYIRKIGSALNSDTFSYINLMVLGRSEFLPYDEFRHIKRERYLLDKLTNALQVKITSGKNIDAQLPIIARQITIKTNYKNNLLAMIGYYAQRKKLPREERMFILTARLILKKITKKIDSYKKMIAELKELKNLRIARKPVKVLLENDYVNIFFGLHAADIDGVMEVAQFLRRNASWLNIPFAILPIQGMAIFILEVPKQFLQHDASRDIFRQIQVKLSEAKELWGASRLPAQEARFLPLEYKKDETPEEDIPFLTPIEDEMKVTKPEEVSQSVQFIDSYFPYAGSDPSLADTSDDIPFLEQDDEWENISVPSLQTAGFWARRASGAIGPGDEKSPCPGNFH